MAPRLPRRGNVHAAQFQEIGDEAKWHRSSASDAGAVVVASRNDRTISILGPDLTVDGDLISKGELRVDGDVQGDIKGVRVVIGETARVTGGVVAEDVVILGHVMGSVRGRRVSLQSASHVEGDVYHQALVIEQGAFFEGTSRRAENPLADLPTAEVPTPNGNL